MLYIFKVQGKIRIPDYVQIRDENYSLLAYFRADRPEKALEKIGLSPHFSQIIQIISEMPFGKMQELNLPEL